MNSLFAGEKKVLSMRITANSQTGGADGMVAIEEKDKVFGTSVIAEELGQAQSQSRYDIYACY